MRPRISDMTGDDLELRKFERDVIEIRDWPAGFRRTKRPRVSDLKTERDAELDTRGRQRVIAAIVGRQVSQPRHDAQVNRGYPDEPVRSVSHAFHDRII